MSEIAVGEVSASIQYISSAFITKLWQAADLRLHKRLEKI